MREIILDTETTGLDAKEHRIIEIGCVEIFNLIPTGKTFHVYINPQRQIDKGATEVHGMTYDMLKKKPTFKRVVDGFLEFIGDSPLVAHNIKFDAAFLNEELARLERPALINPLVDTLELSRKAKPGGRHTLDVMCAHFKINTSKRTLHGALLDATILAELYVELKGGRQMGLDVSVDQQTTNVVDLPARQRPSPLAPYVSDEELIKHAEFIAKMSIWSKFMAVETKERAA